MAVSRRTRTSSHVHLHLRVAVEQGGGTPTRHPMDRSVLPSAAPPWAAPLDRGVALLHPSEMGIVVRLSGDRLVATYGARLAATYCGACDTPLPVSRPRSAIRPSGRSSTRGCTGCRDLAGGHRVRVCGLVARLRRAGYLAVAR